MNARELKQCAAAWSLLANYFRRPLSDDVCRMYAGDLADCEMAAVLRAMDACRRQPGRRQLPYPDELRGVMDGQEGSNADVPGLACDIAGRITESVSKYGYTHPAEAADHMGAVGWQVVQRMGGWPYVCQTLTVERTQTFYAQCRDLARALLTTPALMTALPGGRAAQQQEDALLPTHDPHALPPQTCGPQSAGAILAAMQRKRPAP